MGRASPSDATMVSASLQLDEALPKQIGHAGQCLHKHTCMKQRAACAVCGCMLFPVDHLDLPLVHQHAMWTMHPVICTVTKGTSWLRQCWLPLTKDLPRTNQYRSGQPAGAWCNQAKGAHLYSSVHPHGHFLLHSPSKQSTCLIHTSAAPDDNMICKRLALKEEAVHACMQRPEISPPTAM